MTQPWEIVKKFQDNLMSKLGEVGVQRNNVTQQSNVTLTSNNTPGVVEDQTVQHKSHNIAEESCLNEHNVTSDRVRPNIPCLQYQTTIVGLENSFCIPDAYKLIINQYLEMQREQTQLFFQQLFALKNMGALSNMDVMMQPSGSVGELDNKTKEPISPVIITKNNFSAEAAECDASTQARQRQRPEEGSSLLNPVVLLERLEDSSCLSIHTEKTRSRRLIKKTPLPYWTSKVKKNNSVKTKNEKCFRRIGCRKEVEVEERPKKERKRWLTQSLISSDM